VITIDSQSEVGDWDNYPQINRPANWDTDIDGMPDQWETENGFNSKNNKV